MHAIHFLHLPLTCRGAGLQAAAAHLHVQSPCRLRVSHYPRGVVFPSAGEVISRIPRPLGCFTSKHYRALLTPGYRDIMATEHAATSIGIYAPVGIPELLHAEDYARALAAAGDQMPAAVQDMAVAAAMARQKAILYARPVEVTVILAAAALRQQPSDPAAMRAQLRHLAELAASHPRVTIQLLPLTASLHAAGGSGAFSILHFSQEPAPKLVLADGPGGGTLLDNQQSVAAYEKALEELRTLALTPEESARWLLRMAGGQASTRVLPTSVRGWRRRG